MISRILAEERVPQELLYLAQAESGFLPRAVSNKAAAGMWQFVKYRGQEYGLMQTAQTDDRLDPEKATRSAARHLRDLYEHFGDWYLAIAAYNCGPGNVEKAVQRTGYADFWKLRSLGALPKETTNYVPIIVAMTIMAKNPKEYGLEGIETDAPLEYDTIQLTAPTHLALLADVSERTVSDLRELNPALLSNVAPASYEVRIPKGSRISVLAGLEYVPEERRAAWRVHHVSEGETLASIAKQYNMPVSTISSANKNSANAEAGNVLLIPAPIVEAKRPVAARRTSTASRRAAPASGSNAAKGSKKPAASSPQRAHRTPVKPVHKGGVETASR
jgi:membrane-bound lytic murein transglycosylase D